MDLIEALEKEYERAKLPELHPGDTVRVHIKVLEGQKEKMQVFEGTVIQTRGKGTGKTFTVRKISGGLGVERIFPYNSPSIAKIEVIKRGAAKRAKLFYLRGKKGKAAQVKTQK